MLDFFKKKINWEDLKISASFLMKAKDIGKLVHKIFWNVIHGLYNIHKAYLNLAEIFSKCKSITA